MKRILSATAFAGVLLSASTALACSPVITTDPATSQTLSAEEVMRRGQAVWRADSDIVFIAQVREGRMVQGGEIEFTLTPISTVYGGALPEAMLLYRWTPGHTCNAFTLNLSDLVVVFADVDQIGWSIVGLTTPDRLQDRPAEFRRQVRDIHRGIIPGPALPE